MPEEKKEGHRCEESLPDSTYGPAIRYCFEDEDGKLWVSNDEYASQVNYCPYCGQKAKTGAEMSAKTSRRR